MQLSNLDKTEELAFGGDTMLHICLQQAISDIRELQHALDNPNYKYAGSRIHRNAILDRNNQIREYQNKIAIDKP